MKNILNRRDVKTGWNYPRILRYYHKKITNIEKYGIEYHIVKTYPNGVRVGYIPDCDNKSKQAGTGMAWFPASWDKKKIKRAGEHIAQLKRNLNPKDGVPIFGMYKGVRVGVIMTKGQIGTIFPDSDQTRSNSRRKK